MHQVHEKMRSPVVGGEADLAGKAAPLLPNAVPPPTPTTPPEPKLPPAQPQGLLSKSVSAAYTLSWCRITNESSTSC